MLVPVTETIWAHEDCGQEVTEDENGWSHVDPTSTCTGLYDSAVVGVSIHPAERAVTITAGPTSPVDIAQDAALVIAESLVTADRFATDLTATLSPADLYQLFRKLEEKVQAAVYPPLTIRRRDLSGVSEDDIEEWGLFEFVCPYCGNVREEMTSYQVSFLGQYSDEIGENAANAHEIHFDYETDPGFHELVYLSSCCEQPVAMPEGWTEA